MFSGTLLVVGFVAACADGAERPDQLFASWREVQRGVKSLIVRFSLETRDSVFEERRTAKGTFRLIRTPKGQVLASHLDAKDNRQVQWSGLFNDGARSLSTVRSSRSANRTTTKHEGRRA